MDLVYILADLPCLYVPPYVKKETINIQQTQHLLLHLDSRQIPERKKINGSILQLIRECVRVIIIITIPPKLLLERDHSLAILVVLLIARNSCHPFRPRNEHRGRYSSDVSVQNFLEMTCKSLDADLPSLSCENSTKLTATHLILFCQFMIGNNVDYDDDMFNPNDAAVLVKAVYKQAIIFSSVS